ncbi:MAG TPA: hypothetical protein VGF73_11575, partial [Chthoniobacterales bacterium]
GTTDMRFAAMPIRRGAIGMNRKSTWIHSQRFYPGHRVKQVVCAATDVRRRMIGMRSEKKQLRQRAKHMGCATIRIERELIHAERETIHMDWPEIHARRQ